MDERQKPRIRRRDLLIAVTATGVGRLYKNTTREFRLSP
jgi:hypothetical protein